MNSAETGSVIEMLKENAAQKEHIKSLEAELAQYKEALVICQDRNALAHAENAQFTAELSRCRAANVYDANAHRQAAKVEQYEAALRELLSSDFHDTATMERIEALLTPETAAKPRDCENAKFIAISGVLTCAVCGKNAVDIFGETACKHESVSPGAGYNAWCDKCGGMLPAAAAKTPVAQEPSPMELRACGYAEGGGYISICLDCKGEIWNVEKLCRVCKPCAIKRHLAVVNRGTK